MYKRSDYLRTGSYNVNMSHGLEDWDFYLSLLNKDDIVHCIDEVLFHYQTKEKTRDTEWWKEHLHETLVQVCNNHPEIYDPFKDRVVYYHHELQKMQRMKDSIENSKAYRVSRFLLKPLYWFRRNE